MKFVNFRAFFYSRISKSFRKIQNQKNLINNAFHFNRLRSNPILLNLGCGTRFHPAWINIDYHSSENDIYSWDLKKGIPLMDDCCDAIYASHVIEHFDREGAKRFLSECFRLLKPGGILRIVVPDLEGVARSYLQCLDDVDLNKNGSADRYEWAVIELLDQMVRHRSGGEMAKYWAMDNVPAEDFVSERIGVEYWRARKNLKGRLIANVPINNSFNIGKFRLGGEPHQWMYDRYSLDLLMKNIGLEEIRKCKYYESNINKFYEYFLDNEKDGSIYKPDSLFMEGQKPERKT
jgi:predicted SAM-dependent methyltransferase